MKPSFNGYEEVMMAKLAIRIAALFFISLCFIVPLFAVEQTAQKADVADLQLQIRALQEQIAEMEKKHAAEIQTLRNKVEELFQSKVAQDEEAELKALQRLAEQEATIEIPAEEKIEEVTYKSGALAQQALNPEISVTGDMFAFYRTSSEEREHSRSVFRTFGVHFESYLDPYTRFKSAIEFGEEVGLGEAYFTRYGLLPNFNLTLGKFRQQFGVVNRWHKHGLDQLDFPVPLMQIFGEEGLNQIGVSGEWTIPTRGLSSQGLLFQITNGQNDRLFGFNSKNNPSILLRYNNYRDLSKDTYLEIGTTGLVGWNDEWPIFAEDNFIFERDTLRTSTYGLDITLLWEPTEKMRYRNLMWRSEGYMMNKDILAPDGSGRDDITAWGAYTYVQAKVARTWEIGMRLDYYKPDDKPYADLADFYLFPHALSSSEAKLWQISPYVTWYQSPWVLFRLEYDRQGGELFPVEDRFILQTVFAAGPHKHERY